MMMMDLNRCKVALVQENNDDMEFFIAARGRMERAGAKVDYYEFSGDIKEEIADLCDFYDFVVPAPKYFAIVPIRKRIGGLYVHD